MLNWINKRFPLLKIWRAHVSEYYVPNNLNIYYVFGVLALLILFNQLLTGIWLTMFYTPTVNGAFSSVEYIMRDVNYGWLFRYLHSTGASAFFIVIYLHLFRSLLYGSYQKPRELVWLIGVILFLLLLAEAFVGYLLPWGQLSYWGAQVMTSLFSVVPYVGDTLVTWVRGDYAVGDATLHRFFALHIIAIPLLILCLTYLHIIALHHVGSNNPEGIEVKKVPLHPYYTSRDLLSMLVFLMLFFAIVFFMPTMGGLFLEPENFVQANPLVTPELITPLWYMRPFYAMLRAIPDKSLGVFVMVSSVILLFFMPWLDRSPVRSMRYKGVYSRVNLALFVFGFFVLGYLGSVAITPFKLRCARFFTMIYFTYFLLMPVYTKLEFSRKLPQRSVQ